MDLRDSHQSEVSEREKQTLYINAYMWNLKKTGREDLTYKVEIETRA